MQSNLVNNAQAGGDEIKRDNLSPNLIFSLDLSIAKKIFLV